MSKEPTGAYRKSGINRCINVILILCLFMVSFPPGTVQAIDAMPSEGQTQTGSEAQSAAAPQIGEHAAQSSAQSPGQPQADEKAKDDVSVAQEKQIYLPLISSGSGTIIPETTKVLTQNGLNHLTSISQDGNVFTFEGSPDQFGSPTPGDVLVSGVSNAAPFGFLQKVETVTTAGGFVVVETTPASLEDAIDTAVIEYTGTLQSSDIAESIYAAGVTPASTDQSESVGIGYELKDFVIYDDDMNENTTNDQILLNGQLYLEQGIEFSAQISLWQAKLKELRYVTTLTETVDIEVYSEITESVAESKEVVRHYFSPITIVVGGVPVVIVPLLTIAVGVDGELHVAVRSEVGQQLVVAAGLHYVDGSWNIIERFEPSFTFAPPVLNATLDVTAYGLAELSFNIYGAAGPKVGAKPYLRLEADINASPWWTLYVGSDVTAGVVVPYIVDYSVTVISYSKILAQASIGVEHTPEVPSGPSPAHLATNQQTNLSLSWIGGDLDGDTVLYDVYFSKDRSPPTGLLCDNTLTQSCSPDVLEPESRYYWQVFAEDDDGRTAGPIWEFGTAAAISLDPPSNVSASDNLFDDRIEVTWNAVSNADSYNVYRSTSDESTSATRIATSILGTHYEDRDATPGAYFFYWVEAVNSQGSSRLSNSDRGQRKVALPPVGARFDVALIIDSSSSMGGNDPRGLRKEAAQVFIDAMQDGDQVAIVDYDSSAKVIWPLSVLDAERSGPRNAVAQIDSNGGTNIGLGMSVGHSELTRSATSSPKAAIILADGQGGYTNQASLFVNSGWPVHTVGLGSGVDEVRLRQIADETGGIYYKLESADQLIDVYFAILTMSSSSTNILDTSAYLYQGDTAANSYQVPGGQSTLTVLNNWAGSRVESTLIDPNGRRITASSADSDADVYHVAGATYDLYRVANPIPGSWRVESYGAEIPAGGEEVLVTASVRSPDPPDPPTPDDWTQVGNGSASGGGISNNGGASERPSIVIGSDGNPYIAWHDTSSGNNEIYVRQWTGSQWRELAGSASGGGISNNSGSSVIPNMAVAANGNLYVVWADDSSGSSQAYLKYWNGGSWQQLGNSASGGGISQSAKQASNTFVAFAPGSNDPWVAYRDNGAGDYEIYVKRWQNGAWSEVGGSASGGGISDNSGFSARPMINFGTGGRPYVAWHDNSSGVYEILLRYWSGSQWLDHAGSGSNSGISRSGNKSIHDALAVAGSTSPSVAWSEQGAADEEIWMRYWNGSSWQTRGASASGGGVSNNTTSSLDPALVLDSSSHPYIAWTDGHEIFVKRWTGSAWSAMDGSASGGGISNNSGTSKYSAIAMNNSGKLYVAWMDDSAGDMEIYVKQYGN